MPDYDEVDNEVDEDEVDDGLGLDWPIIAQFDFVNSVRYFMNRIHNIAMHNGHWDSPVDITKSLCWIHSEVSEAFDAWQHGSKPSTRIPFSTLEEELADVFIIMADACQANGFDLARAIVAKIDYNRTREYRHGKVN